MPFTDTLILAAICLAFIVFGSFLAWGEYQTRHLNRSERQDVGKAAQQAKSRTLFVASNSRAREMADR